MRPVGGPTLFLPPSDRQVWVESPVPASPAFALCTSHTAGTLHNRHLLLPEWARGAVGTRFGQWQCELF